MAWFACGRCGQRTWREDRSDPRKCSFCAKFGKRRGRLPEEPDPSQENALRILEDAPEREEGPHIGDIKGKPPGTLEDLLKQISGRADFALRKLSEAVEGRRMEGLSALVSSAYPYVSLLRSFQDEYELPVEWDSVVNGFWNDFQYLRELAMQIQR